MVKVRKKEKELEQIQKKQVHLSLKWSIILTVGLNMIVILVQYIFNFTSKQIEFHLFVILAVLAFGLTLYSTWKEEVNLLLVSGLALVLLFFLGLFARFIGASIVMFILILAVFYFTYMVNKEQTRGVSSMWWSLCEHNYFLIRIFKF